ncbi:MAG TPA: hypothetical protein VH022_14445 [Candidatus Acidoferrum sp.]|jgi:hypothetical protein|nr:hypothetical protein [Candidatus Acidoferrum sp.]
MEMTQYIDYRADLSAVLIRKDGTKRDLGIISKSGRTFSNMVRKVGRLFKRLRRNMGETAAIALLLAFGLAGHLPYVPVVFGLVTTVGVNYMATDFASGGASPRIAGFNYHDSGTGTTAAAIGDTALQTATGNARVAGTQSNPSANIYQTVATLPYTATAAITEWGLFSASTSATMWDHRIFSAINVSNGDSIQFTYKLTIAAGGS